MNSGYKSTYRSQLHFYTLTMKYLKKEIKKAIPFRIASKIVKNLGINLTKEVKDLYTENYKTLLEETEDTNNRYLVFMDGKN